MKFVEKENKALNPSHILRQNVQKQKLHFHKTNILHKHTPLLTDKFQARQHYYLITS